MRRQNEARVPTPRTDAERVAPMLEPHRGDINGQWKQLVCSRCSAPVEGHDVRLPDGGFLCVRCAWSDLTSVNFEEAEDA